MAFDPGSVRQSTAVGPELFFTAATRFGTVGLYVCDGLATQLLKQFGAGAAQAPSNLIAFQGQLFFAADGSDGFGRELWVSDGTQGGTKLFRQINLVDPGAGSGPPDMCVANGRLFFAADDGSHGDELWATDGTQTGTQLYVDIAPGPGVASIPRSLAALGDWLYFCASDGVSRNLYAVKTVGELIVERLDSPLAPNGTDATFVTPVSTPAGDFIFFSGRDANNDFRLWAAIGSGGYWGGKLISRRGSSPNYLTNVNGTLFYSAATTNLVGERPTLWRVQPNQPPVQIQLPSGSDPRFVYDPRNLTSMGQKLAFSAAQGTGRELWISDGTSNGTRIVKQINPNGSSSPDTLLYRPLDGLLFFAATDGARGVELWQTDGTDVRTFIVKDINPNGDSGPYGPQVVNDRTLFFFADDGVTPDGIWKNSVQFAGGGGDAPPMAPSGGANTSEPQDQSSTPSRPFTVIPTSGPLIASSAPTQPLTRFLASEARSGPSLAPFAIFGEWNLGPGVLEPNSSQKRFFISISTGGVMWLGLRFSEDSSITPEALA